MWNLILHPTSTHTAYFWWTPLPRKQEIAEKMWWWHHHHIFLGISCFWGSGVCQKYALSSRFFRYFLFWGQQSLSKVCSVGTRWMHNQISYPMSSPDQNLSKTTMRYVENTNTKSSFFFLPPKLINIILLF